MSSNFQFLKTIDNNLYDIITDAEKLYKNEFFEQCITQTRRFGEQICKNMMEQNNRQTGSFDEMLATLKDQSHGNPQEKEFIDDLYFLKKSGNEAVHSSKVKHSGMTALECLKRSFEAAISYSVYNQGATSDILKLNYDVELLITDKKSKKSLKDKYVELKTKETKKQNNTSKSNNTVSNPSVPKKRNKQSNSVSKINYSLPKISLFWKLIITLTCVSMGILLILNVLMAIKDFS